MNYIASQLQAVKPSASMAVSQAAKALAAQGVDVVDLGLGEPDFATPAHIIEAAHEATRGGQTLYTAALGTPELRRAICDKFRRANGLDYTLDEIIVSNGAKQIIFKALMATLEEGDQAILLAPYFVSYPEMVKLLGGVPVIPECTAEAGFRLTPEVLEAAITPRTKWLFLNMPGNPSGAVYSEAELKALGEVLARHPQVLVLSDEIYEHIVFDGRAFVSFGKACPELRDRSLIVNGGVQGLCDDRLARGLRGGAAIVDQGHGDGPKPVGHLVCSITQAAAIAALDGPQDEVARFRTAFERRRNLVVEGIGAIKGLTLAPPEGAFYAFIGCAALIGQRTPTGEVLKDDSAVARYLLTEGQMAAVPGVAYGLSPFLFPPRPRTPC